MTLPQELYNFLLMHDIQIYGAYTECGSKIVQFYCNDDKIKEMLHKQYYIEDRGIIMGERQYGGYYASMTKKPNKI